MIGEESWNGLSIVGELEREDRMEIVSCCRDECVLMIIKSGRGWMSI